MLDKDELQRYNRHIRLSEIGEKGQLRLKKAKVLVVGAGGLGCPVLQYLVAAGVGCIGVVDADVVDVSNLQRQFLYGTGDVGKLKVESALAHLTAKNPHVKLEAYPCRIVKENALELVASYDIIVDCTDNFPTRYLLNDACVLQDKPLVYGAIYKFDGQVSVFNWQGGPSYRCIFPEPPSAEESPNCAEVGVLGVLPGLIGTLQANEVLKMILGLGEVLSGRLLTYDALSHQQHIVAFEKSAIEIATLGDYEEICAIPSEGVISATNLHKRLAAGDSLQLIDVRETFEWNICHIEGAALIPMNAIPERLNEIASDREVVVYCHHGMRSQRVIDYLSKQGDFNLLNLEGGIHAWAMEVDGKMATY